MCLTYISLFADEDVVLPVHPSLSSTIADTLPSQTVNQDLSTNDSQVEVFKQSLSVVLSERPITTKLLDQLNSGSLLIYQDYLLPCDSTVKTDTVALAHEGQHIPVVDLQRQFNHHKK